MTVSFDVCRLKISLNGCMMKDHHPPGTYLIHIDHTDSFTVSQPERVLHFIHILIYIFSFTHTNTHTSNIYTLNLLERSRIFSRWYTQQCIYWLILIIRCHSYLNYYMYIFILWQKIIINILMTLSYFIVIALYLWYYYQDYNVVILLPTNIYMMHTSLFSLWFSYYKCCTCIPNWFVWLRIYVSDYKCAVINVQFNLFNYRFKMVIANSRIYVYINDVIFHFIVIFLLPD